MSICGETKVTGGEHGNAVLLSRMAAEERKPFLLRLPPALWNDLEKPADELRSVNGQIEYILREGGGEMQKTKQSAN